MPDIGSLLGSAGVGGAVGQAVVRLELDSKKYLAEMEAAKGETVAATNSMGTTTSKFGGLAKTAFLGAGVAAVAFAAVSVKAAIEANAAHLKLQNTFENNRRLADSSVAAFEAQANALRDLTGVDDEAVMGAQALLGQFKLTGTQVMQLIPLIVDLSTKMGIDLESAAKAVGKAATGTTAGLKRYGIQVDETAAKTDAFAATLDALGRVQGFAADSAKLEPWKLIGAQFEEVQEKVGNALIPALQALVPAILDLVAALGPLLDLLGKLGPVLNIVAKGMEILMSPLAAVIGLIDAGIEPTDEMVAVLGAAATAAVATAQAEDTMKAAQDELTGSVTETTTSLRDQLDAILALADPTFALISAVRDNATAEQELADAHQLVNRLAREGKTDTKAYSEAQADLKDKALAAAQSQADLLGAVRRLQEEIASGKTSRQEAIQAIRDLGKEAGLTGKDIRGLVDDVRGGLTDAAAVARRLAPAVGAAMSHGIALGITTSSELISVAAANAVHDAMQAARDAAKAGSPSRVMMVLGKDLMKGLEKGIEDNETLVTDAMKRTLDKAIKEAEKAIKGLEARLSKLQSAASSFRSAIAGGFSSFLDISGAFGLQGPEAISGFFAGQVAGAQELASILKALKAQGASKALLQKIAEAWPESKAFAQQLLQSGPAGISQVNQAIGTIQELAGTTAGGLSEKFFGDKIDELKEELKGLRQDLRELERRRDRRDAHDHPSDSEVIDVIHSGLIKKNRRTGSLQLT